MKILKFYTQTCMLCKIVGKILSKMNVEVENIDALENTSLVDSYNICTTPTLVFLDDENKEVDRIVGNTTQSQIQAILDRYL